MPHICQAMLSHLRHSRLFFHCLSSFSVCAAVSKAASSRSWLSGGLSMPSSRSLLTDDVVQRHARSTSDVVRQFDAAAILFIDCKHVMGIWLIQVLSLSAELFRWFVLTSLALSEVVFLTVCFRVARKSQRCLGLPLGCADCAVSSFCLFSDERQKTRKERGCPLKPIVRS